MYVLNIIAAGLALLMAAFVMRPSNDGWETAAGAALHALAALTLTYLALVAIFPVRP